MINNQQVQVAEYAAVNATNNARVEYAVRQVASVLCTLPVEKRMLFLWDISQQTLEHKEAARLIIRYL